MRGAVQGLDWSRTRGRLAVVLTLIVTLSITALGAVAVVAFDRAVAPELANRTRLIGSIVRTEIQRSVALGIPLEAVGGLEPYLAKSLESFEEVERISVVTASGHQVAKAGRDSAPTLVERSGLWDVAGIGRASFVLPVIVNNKIVGQVTIESSPVFVDRRLHEIFLDVVVITLVASLLAVELALAVAMASVGKPLDRVLWLLDEQRAGNFSHLIRRAGVSGLARMAVRLNDRALDIAERLGKLPDNARTRIADANLLVAGRRPMRLRFSNFNDIRLALFVYSVATEIAAAFLPLYARNANRPAWLSPEIAAAAPLALYLVVLAALSPFSDALARRMGPRRLFLASVLPTAASLAAMAIADNLLEVTLLRGATAAFYAVATIACQQYAIRASAEQSGTRPVAAFVAVVYGGVFCGAALGGLLAGRLGPEAAFLCGGALALLSGMVAHRAMVGRAGDPVDRIRILTDAAASGSTVRLAGLLIGVTIPMNAATAILVWYLAPLMLAALGRGPAEIARVVMLYYLAQVLLGAPVARAGETRCGSLGLIFAGVGLSGAALLSLLAWDGFWAITVAVAGLGVGHALMRAPQTALAIAAAGSATRLGLVRLLERLGALAGLVASAFWLGDLGAESSIRVMGIAVLAGGGLFAFVALPAMSRQAMRFKGEES